MYEKLNLKQKLLLLGSYFPGGCEVLWCTVSALLFLLREQLSVPNFEKGRLEKK